MSPDPELPTLNGNMAANLFAVVKWTDERLETFEARQNARLDTLMDKLDRHIVTCNAAMEPYQRLGGTVGVIARHPRFVGTLIGALLGLLVFFGLVDADAIARFWP